MIDNMLAVFARSQEVEISQSDSMKLILTSHRKSKLLRARFSRSVA